MKLLRTGAFVGKWCAHCVGSFLLWTVWLILAGLLGVQIIIAVSHELRVPTRLVRSFENGMAHAGVRVRFDTASFDSSGHILIENLRVFTESFDEPLLTAKSIYLQIDPWSLLSGSMEARWVSGQGVTLLLPSMVSPSGRSDAVAEDVTLRIEQDGRDLRFRRFTGHAGPLALNLHGSLRLPRPGREGGRTAREEVAAAVAQYIKIGKEIALAQARLGGVDEPTLEVSLTPDEQRVAQLRARFSARAARLTSETLALPKFDQRVEVEGVTVEAFVPALAAATTPLRAVARVRSAELANGIIFQDVSTTLDAALQTKPFELKPRELAGSIGSIRFEDLSLDSISLRARPKPWPKLNADLSFSFVGETWGLHAEGDAADKSGRLSTQGRISSKMISVAGEKLERNLSQYLTPEQPVQLAAQAHFSSGGKMEQATGRFSVGKVVAYNVGLNQAAAHFRYEGDQVLVSDILLDQGQNIAHGSYWMDTKTLDYRFLLTGRLRPVGIAGWFHDWWTRFWGNFDFSAAPPVADVDVQGRWRAPHLSTVFVHVDCDAPIIRGVPLDLVRTTLFIRPDFYDATELYATRGDGAARGRFTRSVDMNKRGFRWMEFAVTSSLDLQESAKLFGKEGTDIVEPFRFAKAPNLKLSGRLEGEASDRGEHEDVSIDVTSTGDFWFYDFPLSNLACRARVLDRDIDVPDVRVNFATGSAQGSARVSGIGAARKLSFEASVHDAGLGESIRILEDFAARRRGEKPPPVSRFQQRVASGRLSFKASAVGLYQSPYSYVGEGTADLKGAELAQVNLLGALSEALRGNSLLGFTSWALDSAHAKFALQREKLVFPELTFTGPTAKLDAKGSYSLEAKTMDFNAKFYPFDQGKTLLASAVDLVLTPVSAALELRLKGSLDKPQWFFTYGPTSLLRKLSGADGSQKKPAEERPSTPSPLLRESPRP